MNVTMKITILFILLVLALSRVSDASPTDNFEQPFFSKKIAKLKWENSEKIFNLIKDWQFFTEEQIGGKKVEGHTIIKEGNFMFGPYHMKGMLQKNDDNGRYRLVFVAPNPDKPRPEITEKFSPDNFNICNRFSSHLNQTLGPAFKEVTLVDGDVSHDMAKLKINSQWKLGSSELVLSCLALKVFDGVVPIIFVNIGMSDDIEDVLDPVYLKCSHKRKYSGILSDEGTEEEPPISIVIDQNARIVSSKNIKLGKTVKYDESQIISEDDTDKIKSIFYLDRIAGSFTMNVEIKDQPGTGAESWGDCEKISIENKL